MTDPTWLEDDFGIGEDAAFEAQQREVAEEERKKRFLVSERQSMVIESNLTVMGDIAREAAEAVSLEPLAAERGGEIVEDGRVEVCHGVPR